MAERLRGLLGEALAGVYLGGSLALGDYSPGRSDVDVAAFVLQRLSSAEKQTVVAAVRHEALPCPARKLELVVSVPDLVPEFELNLNSGEGEHHVDVSAVRGSAFWFAIDASIVRAHGVTLVGPPAAEVIPELPREVVEAAVQEAVRWQIANHVPPDDLVLNACRARRFLAEDVWSSKDEAGRWALGQTEEPATAVVATALAIHRREPGVALPTPAAQGVALALIVS